MWKSCLVAISLVPVMLAAPAVAQPAAIDLSGDYTGTWGTTTLTQTGDHVTGTYTHDDGEIDGYVDGDRIHFTWREDRGRGRGVFVIAPDGSLHGTWGYDQGETDGGEWQLTPMKSGPSSGWAVGLRMPWDVQLTPNNITMGVVGVGLDLGRHLDESRWYVGASTDYELEIDMEPPDSGDGPGAFGRFRVGGEARYYFHDGIAGVSVDDGPVEPVPRHDWLGLRGGAETFDGFTHTGEFADLTFGWDAQLGGAQIGMYLTGGVSLEPESVFPGTAPSTTSSGEGAQAKVVSSPSATYHSAYFALGIHFALG